MNVDNADAALAIRALGWLSGQDGLRDRFLHLTGIAPAAVPGRLADHGFLGAVIGFLGYDDRTLAACAEAIGVQPEDLAAAGRRLGAEDR